MSWCGRCLLQREQGSEAPRNREKDLRLKPGDERESKQRWSEVLEVLSATL